jgi:hypothetical protein
MGRPTSTSKAALHMARKESCHIDLKKKIQQKVSDLERISTKKKKKAYISVQFFSLVGLGPRTYHQLDPTP